MKSRVKRMGLTRSRVDEIRSARSVLLTVEILSPYRRHCLVAKSSDRKFLIFSNQENYTLPGLQKPKSWRKLLSRIHQSLQKYRDLLINVLAARGQVLPTRFSDPKDRREQGSWLALMARTSIYIMWGTTKRSLGFLLTRS